MDRDNNKLIYGKSNLKHVVGLEIKDDEAEVFQQQEDGTVTSSILSNRFWILASSNIDGSFTRLQGDLHYCWGRQFSKRKEWMKWRSIWRNSHEDIYAIYDPTEALMVKNGICYYQDLKQKDISLLSFDLETTGLDGTAHDAKIILISTTYRDTKRQYNRLFSHDEYDTEGDMIDAFCTHVLECNPSLLMGHNIVTYDFVYLQARAERNNTKLYLGRDDSEIVFDSFDSKFRMDGTRSLEYKNVHVHGREIVDTYFLISAFDVSKSIESYALKPLVKQLGFEKEGRQYYDAQTIRKNYLIPEEMVKIKKYAIEDSEDSVKIWDHAGPLYFNMAGMMSKPFGKIILSASGSKINGMLVRAYLQEGHSIPKADEVKKFQGALSWGKPGIYRNVKKVDAISLYPSVIIQYSVFPEDKDPRAYLLELVKTFRTKRLEYKKLAADTGDSYYIQMDTTAKGILNSFFGFFGCPGLNFNSFECAEFITETGREILETAIHWATGKKFQEIAPDYYESDEAEEQEIS